MANAASASLEELANRQLAAEALLQGYADGDIAAVLSTADTAGFAAVGPQIIVNASVGGIIGGINR